MTSRQLAAWCLGTFLFVAGCFAQQPRTIEGVHFEVLHSRATDLLGILTYAQGWVPSAPSFGRSVSSQIDIKKHSELLASIREVIERGRSSVVGMLNCGVFIDLASDVHNEPVFTSREYGSQLKSLFLDTVFNNRNRAWVAFSTDSNVVAIQDASEIKYDAVERYLRNFLDLRLELAFLERAFGVRFGRYVVVPSFYFFPYSGTGFSVDVHGERVAFFVFGPQSDLDISVSPDLRSAGFTKTTQIASLALHEFAHSFFAERFGATLHEKIEDLRSIYDKSPVKLLKGGGYNPSNWDGIYEEYFVRSLEILFMEERGKHAEAEARLENERSRGFVLIDGFLSGIRTAYNKRDLANALGYIRRSLEH